MLLYGAWHLDCMTISVQCMRPQAAAWCAGRLMPKLRMTIRTARGELTVVVDILTIIPGLHMVELHKGAAGDAASFYQYYSELLPLVR